MLNYELNEIQKDVLREIGNIGGGNAATALSSLLTDRVNMTVPFLRMVGVNEIAELLGGPGKEVVGILVFMTDDIKGMLMFILDRQFTHLMINALLNKKIESFENINEMDMSALMEMGNMMSGAYISALSQLTGMDIRLSTPQIAIDMVGAIISFPATQFVAMGDKVLYIEEDFSSSGETIKSHLLIMPELESLEIILKRLGVA